MAISIIKVLKGLDLTYFSGTSRPVVEVFAAPFLKKEMSCMSCFLELYIIIIRTN